MRLTITLVSHPVCFLFLYLKPGKAFFNIFASSSSPVFKRNSHPVPTRSYAAPDALHRATATAQSQGELE